MLSCFTRLAPDRFGTRKANCLNTTNTKNALFCTKQAMTMELRICVLSRNDEIVSDCQDYLIDIKVLPRHVNC